MPIVYRELNIEHNKFCVIYNLYSYGFNTVARRRQQYANSDANDQLAADVRLRVSRQHWPPRSDATN